MGARLHLIGRVRFVVAFAVPVAAALAELLPGVVRPPLVPLVLIGVFIALYNVVLIGTCPRTVLDGEVFVGRRALVRREHALVALDYLSLTLALALVGGASSPFRVLYLFHVMLSALVLTPRAAALHAALGMSLYASLAGLERAGLPVAPDPFGASVPIAEMPGPGVALLVGVLAFALFLCLALVTRLVADLREGEARLALANRELHHLSSLRRDFLHIVLHDVKAPVGAVRSVLSALASGYGGPISDDQKTWIERCLGRLEGLTRFLRELGTISELDARALHEKSEDVDLAEVVREVVAENEDLARVRGLELAVAGPERLRAVRGQRRLLHEAILNYVTNAMRYTPKGGHVLVCAREHAGHAVVEVRDDGPGMKVADQARLFREFTRLAPARGSRHETPRSGLGLSIVKRIAELHRGKVRVRSTPGEGSSFYLEIPLADELPGPGGRRLF